MAEQIRGAAPAEVTVTLLESEDDLHQDVHTVRLKLRKPESKKKVQWQSGTVDNENMNKKKSKSRVKKPEKILHPEDEDTVILRSIRKCLLNDTASTSKKTYLFNTNSCCQYEKPRAFNESSSSSEDECENCHGHVERKKKNKKDPAVSTGASAELEPSTPN